MITLDQVRRAAEAVPDEMDPREWDHAANLPQADMWQSSTGRRTIGGAILAALGLAIPTWDSDECGTAVWPSHLSERFTADARRWMHRAIALASVGGYRGITGVDGPGDGSPPQLNWGQCLRGADLGVDLPQGLVRAGLLAEYRNPAVLARGTIHP